MSTPPAEECLYEYCCTIEELLNLRLGFDIDEIEDISDILIRQAIDSLVETDKVKAGKLLEGDYHFRIVLSGDMKGIGSTEDVDIVVQFKLKE